MTKDFAFTARRKLLAAGTVGAAGLASPAWIRPARAQTPPLLRYATGGGVGPNEIETVIFEPWMRKNVLKRHGREYALEMTFTRGTPEAGTLLAAGQVDLCTMSFPVFAQTVLKNTVPGGVSIMADVFVYTPEGNAADGYFVLADSPIKSVADLRGKKIAVNAFGSAVDLAMRVRLKKEGLDPRKDAQVVEIGLANIAAALREKRVDCGVLALPFLAGELQTGGLRPLFSLADAFGRYAAIFQVASNRILERQPAAVRAYLADYVEGLQWLYDPANRKQAIALAAQVTKSPVAVLESYFLTERDYFRDRNACISASVVQAPVDALADEGLIDRRIAVKDYVNTAFLPAACGGT
ncbi:MAG: ABC transporter substrate-binding protein [Lautropia sp.]